MSNSFLNSFSRGLAGNLSGALAADSVKDAEQSIFGQEQIAILIDGSLRIQSAITDQPGGQFHNRITPFSHSNILTPPRSRPYGGRPNSYTMHGAVERAASRGTSNQFPADIK